MPRLMSTVLYSVIQYDAIQMLKSMFMMRWNECRGQRLNGPACVTVELIFGEFQRMCSSGDANTREMVLVGALEELFQSREIRSRFDAWKSSIVLRPIYEEASVLSGSVDVESRAMKKKSKRGGN